MIINPYTHASAGGTTDPYFADVGLLIHFNALVGGNLLDSSSHALTLGSAGGFPLLDTTNQNFGVGCCDFATALGGSTPGHDVSIAAASGGPIDLSAGDYTVEGWFYSRSGTAYILFGTTYLNHIMLLPTGTSLATTVENTTLPGGTISLNAWHHIALDMISDQATVYIDGVATGSPTAITRASWGTETFYVGGSQFGPALRGLAHEFRITKGVARHTSGFTPTLAEFPNS